MSIDIDIAPSVASLENAGYEGYCVLERDTILTDEPRPGDGQLGDVRQSIE